MHLFYQPLLKKSVFRLENEEHQHCIKVLRHKIGDLIHITDGLGQLASATITEISKKETHFKISKITEKEKIINEIILAISPTKQIERMEWFVEKASEIGVDQIFFITTKNSVRSQLKLDRLEKKTISALKQSKSCFKTQLHSLTSFKQFIEMEFPDSNKLLAYVDEKGELLKNALENQKDHVVIIGPEGDFTEEEVELAVAKGYKCVSLGKNVLRTETAGLYAGTLVSSYLS